MKEFIFSFNFTGYISTGVKKIDEKTLTLNGFNMYTQDFKHPIKNKAIADFKSCLITKFGK